MYNRLVDKVLYSISVFFLVGSIYVHTFGNKTFEWTNLFGTDGLTLFGLIIALITMLSMRLSVVKKIFRWFLLKINHMDIDYRVKVKVSSDKDLRTEDILNKFIFKLKDEENKFPHHYDLYKKTNVEFIGSFRGIASNLIIRKGISNIEDNEINYPFSIELNGISKFNKMDKNIKFFVSSFLEYLRNDRFSINSISLSISKKNSELDIVTEGLLIDKKTNTLESSNIVIRCNNESSITLNNFTGIDLNSDSIAKFLSAYEVIQDILIS